MAQVAQDLVFTRENQKKRWHSAWHKVAQGGPDDSFFARHGITRARTMLRQPKIRHARGPKSGTLGAQNPARSEHRSGPIARENFFNNAQNRPMVGGLLVQ